MDGISKTDDPGLLGELLPQAQIVQLQLQLIAVMQHGFGRLEIEIGNHRVRHIIPRRVMRSPGPQAIFPLPEQNPLGDWERSFRAGLSEIIESGWGTLAVIVEYGRVAGLDIAPSLPADIPGDLPGLASGI